MKTILILSDSPTKTNSYLSNVYKEHSIAPIDVSTVDFSEDKKGIKKQSIGISEVRQFQKKALLKPIKGEVKSVIFNSADSLTAAAQNALLKTLEEPPPNTIVILVGQDLSSFLPTILSRCFIINLKEKREIKRRLLRTCKNPSHTFNREKLLVAQTQGKDKQSALLFLSDITQEFHTLFLNGEHNAYTHVLTKFQKTYTIIKTTNVNPRFALENLLLSISEK